MLKPITLRPIKRHKRPSCSPQKWHQPEHKQSRSQSYTATSPPVKEDPLHIAVGTSKTAALEFEEFSYIDEEGKFRRIEGDWIMSLADYMGTNFQAISIEENLPYLIVWCKDKIPAPSDRPFLIAGLVTIWRVEGKDGLPEDLHYGEAGRNSDKWLDLDQDLLDDLNPFIIPEFKTLHAIMDHFTEAIALSFINHTIVVELPQTTRELHNERLQHFPVRITDSDVPLRFKNGVLHGQELKRSKTPCPKILDGVYDDTDYVQTQGSFNPGAMLSSQNQTMITAGINVQKNLEQRLTVAIHCWDQQLNAGIDLGAEEYAIKQGDWDSGTLVGKVIGRIGNSDIGLASIDVPFSNRLLDLSGSVRTLAHSSTMKDVGEAFWVDTFVTGPQNLASAGRRVYQGTPRDLVGESESLPVPGIYIRLEQGIFATSVPEINSEPIIREGVCGAAILRGTHQRRKNSPKKGTPVTKSSATSSLSGSTLATPVLQQAPREETTGEVAGFMHWPDLQSRYNGDRLFCFADAVDNLIKDGWEVVPAVEKRSAGVAGLDDNSDPFVV